MSRAFIKKFNALLDGPNDPALVTKYKDVMAQLPAMTELYEKRLALRKARGAMDIESDEAKLVMDAKAAAWISSNAPAVRRSA